VHGLYSVNAYSRIMTRGERVIAVSDAARDYVIDNYSGVDPQSITTIYRGVDRTDFPYGYKPNNDWLESWYESYPFLRDRKVLTLPGRLTRLKGHADFVELINGLVDKGVPVHGLVVGDLDPGRKKYIGALKRSIADSGLAERITFTGQRQDIREIYACSDIVFSLSRKPESFGRTVLEALCLGVPVVGYDHGGVGEILDKLYPAGKVLPGDAGALLERTAQLLGRMQPVPPSQMFSLDEMLGKTLGLYQSLADIEDAAVPGGRL